MKICAFASLKTLQALYSQKAGNIRALPCVQTVGIHLKHNQGHEVSDGGDITQGFETRNHSHTLSHTHAKDISASAEDGTLSCNNLASLDRMVIGMPSLTLQWEALPGAPSKGCNTVWSQCLSK